MLLAVLFTSQPVGAQNLVQVTVSFAQDRYDIAEGGLPQSQQITINLNADPQRTVVIPITVTEYDGATGADYSVRHSVVFNSGETSRTITFTAIDDTVDDDGEEVTLVIGDVLPAGVTAGSRWPYTDVFIDDDDIPETLTVSLLSYRAFVNEGETFQIELELSDIPEREIVIPITVTNLSGATSADYSALQSSVTFGSDEDEKEIEFTATVDTVDDDGEVVRVSFGSPLPSGVSVRPPRRGVAPATRVTIIDGGVVSLGLAQVGVGVTAHICGHVENEDCKDARIINEAWQWQRSPTEFGTYTDIPAAEGGTSNPYTPSPGDLGMWLKAKVTYDLTGLGNEITVTGRTAQEITQQPVLWEPTVSNAGFANFDNEGFAFGVVFPGTNSYAQAFTAGPDPRGYVLVGVRVSLYQRRTAAGTWAVYADDAGKPASEPISAAFPLTNINSAPDSFEELTIPTGLPLQPGTKYWIVISGTSPSEDGYFMVSAWNRISGVFSDLYHQGQLVVGRLHPGYPEQWTGATFAINIIDEMEDDTRYRATSPTDEASEDGWDLNLPALSWHVGPRVIRELLPWSTLAERINVPEPMALQMSVLIAPEVTVEFSAPEHTAAEGELVSVEVELSADPRRTITIPITATGEDGATADDYSVPPSVTFNAGETSKTLAFTATQDAVDDDDESVKLELGTMPDAYVTAGTQTESTVAITDDDDPIVTVTYDQNRYTVDEGGTQDVTVTLNADPERTLIIPIETTNLGGATAADYSGVPPSVTFNSGETSTSFTVSATDDDLDDDDESVLLGFGTMPDDRMSANPHAQAGLTIVDDDDPHVTVQYGQDTQGVGEGETVNVTFSMSADPERTVTIPITAAGQDGATSADYSVPSSVTFNAGELEKAVAFMAAADDADDDDESVRLGFGSSLPDRVTLGARTQTTLDIGDDDDPTVTVEFGQGSFTVSEGATQQVTVSVSADPERTIIIPITVTAQGTVSDADYSGVPPSVTFNAGETSKTITFTATQDQIDDDGEGVSLGFGTMPDPRVSAGTQAVSTLTIEDDDVADIVIDTTLASEEQVSLNRFLGPDSRGQHTLEDATGYTARPGSQPSENATPGISSFEGKDFVQLDSDIIISQTTITVGEEETFTYTVRLDTEPTVEVTVNVSGHVGSDIILETTTLTFTPMNWNIPQTVRATAGNDFDGVNDQQTLTYEGTGGEYTGLTKNLEAIINDNDPLGIVISPVELVVDESSSATYTVRLATLPTEDLTVTITGHAGTDLILSGDTLTFTDQDWNMTQTVMVSAAHDEDWEDDSAVLTHTGGQAEYEGLSEDLPVTIDDNTGDLRLVDGTMFTEGGDPCEGRLEIYYDGQWGTICDDYWSQDDADTACRALGFPDGYVYGGPFGSGFFPPGDPDQPIWLDDLSCNGGESHLLDCRSSPVGEHNCQHAEDIGLRCVKTTGPWIVNAEFSPPSGGDGRYAAGETVEVTLVWSESVTVSTTPNGFPRVALLYGGQADLLYRPTGSATDRMVYRYTLREIDGETTFDHIGLSADSLALHYSYSLLDPSNPRTPSASISSVATGNAAILGHRTYRSNEEGTMPSTSGGQSGAIGIVGAPAFGEAGEDGVLGVGEYVELTFNFSQPVRVDITGGTPSAGFLLGGTTARQAPYLRGSGTPHLVFGYTLVATDGEHSSLLVDPNSLVLNGGTIRDVATGLDADIRHQGGGVQFTPPADDAAPRLQSATVDGGTLELTYSEALDSSAMLSLSAFAVNVNGASRSVLGGGIGGSQVLLFLSSPVEAGDIVTVGYTAPTGEGTGRVQDVAGNPAASFGGQVVTNNTTAQQQSTPGSETSEVVDPETPDAAESDVPERPQNLSLEHHESGKLLAAWEAPGAGTTPTGYTLQWKESGDDWAQEADVSEADVDGTSHVIVGLTDGTEYAARVIARNGDLASEPSDEASATPRETTPPTVSSAAVDGAALTLTFNETLDAGDTPLLSAFGVTVGDSSRGVDAVAVSGSRVTLSLVAAVVAGETVAVGYTVPSDDSAARLRDLAGNAAASITGLEVANNTQATDPLTAGVSELPPSHNGHFTFELRFSEEPEDDFSYKTMRDHAFTVTGGTVAKARRLAPPSNIGWEVHITPDGNGPVNIVLPVTTDCTLQGAICTGDRRPLSERLEIAVTGTGE